MSLMAIGTSKFNIFAGSPVMFYEGRRVDLPPEAKQRLLAGVLPTEQRALFFTTRTGSMFVWNGGETVTYQRNDGGSEERHVDWPIGRHYLNKILTAPTGVTNAG